MNLPDASPWIQVAGELCENPLWDSRAQCLYWTDIPTGRLFRHDWATAQTTCIYDGPKVGGFTLQEDGSLLLFREQDIATFHAGAQAAELFLPFVHGGSTRFNDVIAVPGGRVFAGTIGHTQDSGGLMRLDPDGTIRQVFGGTGCANGLALSPSLDTLYWVCSTRRRIFAFPYDGATGNLGEPRIFHQNTEIEGIPDGLTVDAEGNVYSIRWEAQQYGLAVFDPQGNLLLEKAIAAKATTSLCFCGPDLTQIAITSAALDHDPERPADLFRIDHAPVPGRVEFRTNLTPATLKK